MVSQVVTDEVVWTDEGRAALAQEYTWGVPSFRASTVAELHAVIGAALDRYRACWERGLAKCDGTGRPLVEWAMTWRPGAPATVEQAAGLASLLGARSGPYPGCALIELLLREHGAGFVMRVAVAAWSLCSDYDDPDYPKSEQLLAIRLKAMDGGDSSANDTSVSHAKGQIAEYLARVHRESSADLRAELATAATAEFDAAPRHARPALAVAAQSREILERKCEGTQGPYARQQLVDVLVNIRGMSAARLLAAFAGKTPVTKQVRAYFERYPELAPADLAAAQKPATKKPAAKKPAARKPSPSR